MERIRRINDVEGSTRMKKIISRIRKTTGTVKSGEWRRKQKSLINGCSSHAFNNLDALILFFSLVVIIMFLFGC
jgi:hypothetical protein